MIRIAVGCAAGFAGGFVLGAAGALLDMVLTYQGKVAGSVVLGVIILAILIALVPMRKTAE